MIYTQKELLDINWKKAFHSFDWEQRPDLEKVQKLSDTQLDYVIVCVGAKRSCYWDRTTFTYINHRAFRYPTKKEATDAMLVIGQSGRMPEKYLRLVGQPKPEMDLDDFWPESCGYHHFTWVINDKLWPDRETAPEAGTKLEIDGKQLEIIKWVGSHCQLSSGNYLTFEEGYGLCRPN